MTPNALVSARMRRSFVQQRPIQVFDVYVLVRQERNEEKLRDPGEPLRRQLTSCSCSFFEPSSRLIHSSPPVRAVEPQQLPLVQTRHASWPAQTLKCVQS
jgi:hypothetical protein